MDKKLTVIGEIYSEDVFSILMDYEIARAKRYPTPISLICIEITPTASNDETLNAASALFASALNRHMRSADIPCLHGREFKIMLPSTTHAGLQGTCERMLSIFKNRFETEDGNTIAFSLNIGGASHEGGATLSREALTEKATAALSQSKQKGQNTFVIVT
jgi:diguanylate cyclase (GGDEF)-like protein